MTDTDRELPIVDDALDRRMNRRALLVGTGLGAMSAVAAAAAGSSNGFVERMLRRRFVELSPDRKAEILAELEREYAERYQRDITVSDTPPIEGVEFGYGLDIARCVGCRRCVYACVHENNQSRDPQIHWIRVLRMEKETGIHLTESNPYYEPELVPEEDAF
jgi:molybdopterin-containing oxidoreductase family iron-sulfur binding subunit